MQEQADVPVFGERVAGKLYVPRPSAYALIADAHGRLAIVRTRQGRFLPGGGIEGAETPDQAVVREALEECGLHIRAAGLVGRAVELSHEEQRYLEKLSVFVVGEDAGRPPTAPTEKDHELAWVAPDDALRLLAHASQRWAVQRWSALVVRPPLRA